MLDSLFTKGLIQLQIECKKSSKPHQCYICDESFQMQDARVIACNAKGDRYGDICGSCISKGSAWLASQLQRQSLQLS